MSTKDRLSPSGPVTSIKGTLAIAETPVATTGAATATGTFEGALVGDVVELSPKANLTASIGIAWSRVVASGVIAVGFTNVGASTAQAAVTFDAVAKQY